LERSGTGECGGKASVALKWLNGHKYFQSGSMTRQPQLHLFVRSTLEVIEAPTFGHQQVDRPGRPALLNQLSLKASTSRLKSFQPLLASRPEVFQNNSTACRRKSESMRTNILSDRVSL